MSIFEWLSVGSNAASIIALFLTLKQYNLKAFLINPYTKVFGLSLIFTATVFLIPWKKIHIDNEKLNKEIVVKNRIDKVHDTIFVQTSSLKKDDIVAHTKPHKNKHPFENPIVKKSNRDTFVKNQTVISGGSDIHTITGNGNHDIINGNVEVKEPKLLSEKELQDIYNATMRYYSEQPQKLISIDKCDYSNAANVFKQVIDFFDKKGVTFSIGMSDMMDPRAPIVQNILINPNATNGKEINILVGKFK